jgi:hypothetical protein
MMRRPHARQTYRTTAGKKKNLGERGTHRMSPQTTASDPPARDPKRSEPPVPRMHAPSAPRDPAPRAPATAAKNVTRWRWWAQPGRSVTGNAALKPWLAVEGPEITAQQQRQAIGARFMHGPRTPGGPRGPRGHYAPCRSSREQLGELDALPPLARAWFALVEMRSAPPS